MKRFLLVAALAGILVVALAAVSFAAPPTPQAGQTFGPGAGIHTPGTGLTDGVVPGAGQMRGRQAMGGGMGYGMAGGAAWAGQPDEVQTFLGLTEAQIQAKRVAGQSLAQVAVEQGKTRDALVNTILNAKKTILDQQVAAGKLTQTQADAVSANMQAQATVMVDRTDVGPGCGGATGQATGTRLGMGGRWNR